jgi:ubiquinone/menaquinone biosynthesis C-methylase UbiE
MYDDPNTKYHRHANRVKAWVTEKEVLDVGAGDGKITSLLNAVGIYNDETAVRLANEKGVKVVLGSAYSLPFANNEFEAVFMGDTLEHCEYYLAALCEARRVLSKYLYLVVPEKGTNNDPYHYQEWTAQELSAVVPPVGFKLVDEILEVSKDKRLYAKFEKIWLS